MSETLAEIRKRVERRLSELEPLVEEYRRLQEAAESLGMTGRTAESNPKAAHTRRATRQPAGTQGRRRRAPRGQNRESILALVGQRPGIRNREIADETGIGRRVVATAVSKYKRDGLLVSDGDGVRLADEAKV